MMTVMLTCNDANVLIVRTIDDALSGAERAALRRHLGSCARCRGEYETQHEVRRLLVLHIQDRLPAGFDDRLRARLAQTSRPETSRPLTFGAMQRDKRGRGRAWTLRLIPLAATLALIVAGTSVRDDVSRPASVSGAAPGQPRAFTTVVLPRTDRASRRHRPSAGSPISADDVAFAPAQPPADQGERHTTQAIIETAAARDTERVRESEPEKQERERIAKREDDASRKRADDERADDERAGDERAASQQPGILPRPPAPIPHARPAMPAPPAVMPDRTIPPP
jgi:hypothetical protein